MSRERPWDAGRVHRRRTPIKTYERIYPTEWAAELAEIRNEIRDDDDLSESDRLRLYALISHDFTRETFRAKYGTPGCYKLRLGGSCQRCEDLDLDST